MKIFLKKHLKKDKLLSFLKFIVSYITTQNIINIAIIPIYTSWGLSFSLLSFFGNILFVPFITIYIFISIIILIGLIFEITFYPLIYFLKIITNIWIFLMQKLSSKYFCIYFIDDALFTYTLCWSFFLIIIKSKFICSKINRKFIFSSILFILTIFILKLKKPFKNICISEKNNKKCISYYINNKLYLFDYLNRTKGGKFNKNDFLYYTLSQNLAKQTGSNIIDKYIYPAKKKKL